MEPKKKKMRIKQTNHLFNIFTSRKMAERRISQLVKHPDNDYGVGIILDKRCVVYTSDMITDDQWVYTVFWTRTGKQEKHFQEELEDL